MDCIAHRGFAGVNPENTLAAVRDAVDRADGVEVDVRRCGSGELVVCHDATVDRVTASEGRVDALDRGVLAGLSVEDSGAGVPTFAAVVDAVPADVTLHAELKETGLGGDAVALASGADPTVVVSSFEPLALREVDEARESPRDVPTALLTTDLSDPAAVIERAGDLDCRAVHPPTDEYTPGFVERAGEVGLAVNVWTVTDPAETRRARAAGVDGVITDYPSCCPSAAGR